MFTTSHIRGISRVGIAATVVAGGLGVVVAPAADAVTTTRGTVIGTGSDGLNVHDAPSTTAAVVGRYAEGATLALACRLAGTTVLGTRTWYSLGGSGARWVSGEFVRTSGSVPGCPVDDTGLADGRATVAVNLRQGPTTADPVVGSLAKNTRVNLVCKVTSQRVDGNALWYYTTAGSWVSARYVANEPPPAAGNTTPVWCR